MFPRQSLLDWVTAARGYFRAFLPGTDAWVWPNNIAVTAKVLGAALYEIEGRLDYVADQIFLSTCDLASLIRYGNDYGLPRLPDAPASGNLIAVATTATTIAQGAVLLRADGVAVSVLTAATIAAGSTMLVPVAAVASGAAANSLAGTSFTASTGVTGTVTFTVDGNGIAGGADVEDPEAYRARLQFRKRYPPHGGSASDYVMWCQASNPAITRVYVERCWNGPGTVRVFPLTDAASPSGVPSPATVAAVAEALSLVEPAGAVVTVAAAVAQPINVTISGLTPSSLSVREAVLAELADAFTRLSAVAGNDTPNAGLPFLATPQSFAVQWIWGAVNNAAGEARAVVTAPTADVVIAAGAIATLGNVTFV